MATAIAVCGSGVGIALLSLGANIIDNLNGWQGYVLFCASMCPFCGILACLAIILPEKCEKEVPPLSRNDYEIIEDVETNSRYEHV